MILSFSLSLNPCHYKKPPDGFKQGDLASTHYHNLIAEGKYNIFVSYEHLLRNKTTTR